MIRPTQRRLSGRRPKIWRYDGGGEVLESYYLRTGDIDRGVSVYADLVAKHPKSTPIKLAYARLLIAKKDIPAAKSVIAGLVKTDASDPGVALLNGILLLNDGKTNEAFDVLQKAEKNSPDNAPVRLWLGRAALVKGDLNTAQQSFTDALKLNPSNLEAADGLAQTAMRRQDPSCLARSLRKQSLLPRKALSGISGEECRRLHSSKMIRQTLTSTRHSSSIRRTRRLHGAGPASDGSEEVRGGQATAGAGAYL